MPTSTPRSGTRKATPRKAKQPTTNALQAEAQPDKYDIVATWRGHEFTVNLRSISWGRIAYGARFVANEKRPMFDRANAAIDLFETLLGEKQADEIIAAEPTILDDPAAMTEFWDALISAIAGAQPGESKAS